MELRIENVPDDVVRAVKMEALASGKTLRGLVIESLERIASGENQVQAEAQEQSTASLRARSSNLGQCGAAEQSKKAAPVEPQHKTSSEEHTPCRHGLTFHPGCNI